VNTGKTLKRIVSSVDTIDIAVPPRREGWYLLYIDRNGVFT
jgi:hypothetical protein